MDNTIDTYLKDYPAVLTIEDIAEILQVTTKTVRKLIADNQIPHMNVGRLIRIPKDKFITYLNEAC